MSRTKNSAKNAVVSLIGQLVQIVIQFVCRSVFIQSLSAEYLGLSGLFSNILSVLSLAELGFGTALIYSMYKPIYDDDKDQIRRLINLYKRIYIIICVVIGAVGLCLMPFLHLLIRDYDSYTGLGDIRLFYFIYLVNTISSYLYIYKKSIIDAYQKNYIYVTIQKLLIVAQNLIQIVFLIITRNFVVYLLIQVATTITTNIIISIKADKMFLFLREDRTSLPATDTKRAIYKNTVAMAMHKIGAVVVGSTDNMILSSMVSLVSVGIYSNYLLIISNLNGFIELIFKAVTASVGDLGASQNKKRLTEVFNTLNFIQFWIYSFSSICLYVLLNHFIHIWLGEDYVFNSTIVFVLVLNYYLKGMRVVINVFRDSLGLFWYDRYKPIFEALVNLVFSIVLVKSMGIVGVFIGTAISTLTVCFWVEPYILYKHALQERLSKYFVTYLKYSIITIVAGYLMVRICGTIPPSILGLFIKIGIITVLYNAIIIACFFRSEEYNESLRLFKSAVKRHSTK